MSENTSTYGTVGAAALIVAVVAWGAAVVMGEAGSNPDAVTQSIGYLGLVLLAVGIVTLVAMLVSSYKAEAA